MQRVSAEYRPPGDISGDRVKRTGKKVIVWPEELAPGKPRFPTPPWSRRQ